MKRERMIPKKPNATIWCKTKVSTRKLCTNLVHWLFEKSGFEGSETRRKRSEVLRFIANRRIYLKYQTYHNSHLGVTLTGQQAYDIVPKYQRHLINKNGLYVIKADDSIVLINNVNKGATMSKGKRKDGRIPEGRTVKQKLAKSGVRRKGNTKPTKSKA